MKEKKTAVKNFLLRWKKNFAVGAKSLAAHYRFDTPMYLALVNMSDELWAYIAQVIKELANFLLRCRILDLSSIKFLLRSAIIFDYVQASCYNSCEEKSLFMMQMKSIYCVNNYVFKRQITRRASWGWKYRMNDDWNQLQLYLDLVLDIATNKKSFNKKSYLENVKSYLDSRCDVSLFSPRHRNKWGLTVCSWKSTDQENIMFLFFSMEN